MYAIPAGYSLFQEDLDHVLKTADSALRGLSGAHILITGGTGFFGQWLVESLLWANDRLQLNIDVSVLSRDPERFLAKKAPHLRARAHLFFVEGKVSDFAFPEKRVTHIINAASENNIENTPDWPLRHLTAALDGTRHLLDLAAAHKIDALLQTTSGAVYLNTDRVVDQRFVEGPASLADYVSEKSVYGQAKRMMEVMTAVDAQAKGYRALVARCFCFVGPYLNLDSNYAIGNFMRDALAGKEIVVNGDGTPLRSYLYMSDLTAWLLVILAQGNNGTAYNVGGHQAYSIAEVAREVAALAEPPQPVQVRQAALPGAIPNAYLPDVSRAKTGLGLDVHIDLAEGIRRTLAWQKQQTSVNADAPKI